MSRIYLPGTSLERQTRASPGRHFRTSVVRLIRTLFGCQIRISPDGQIESLGNVLGTLEEDVLGTSWGAIFAYRVSKAVMYEFSYDYVKPKIWWKCKTLLYGYRQLHCSCKTKIYLGRYCKRCWNKAWHLKFWKNKKVIGLMKMN